ncbi:potassium channel family protein [Halanaeroarchaeum sulfurireducens]|uniref:Ion channel pore / TrkA domain protein n=1 Tax=Halanaeroarchaeum sulfurireducens TaxID=1604004 RepID=A0A0F7PBL1_9EURY|nr:potassium channel protein [Halanaeroarchaeum sulfurireducens]AKH97034.1 ion channel pore / TrkA domain protein [Halanaeroarchaeum sulfurireducens]
MDKWQRRTLQFTLGLFGVMFAYAVFYYAGMTVFEGRSITFFHALQVVVETFTTTGFGSDSPWSSPVMNAFVIVMDLTGVALIFLAFPVLLFPFLDEVLSTTVPRSVEEDLEDHVVICSYTERVRTLIEELESRDIPYVIVDADRDRALDLYEDGHRVVYADPETVEGLERVRLDAARALVVDRSDCVDTSIVLTAREAADDITIVSVLENPEHATYHRLAGADHVLCPRPLLGESLASRVLATVSPELEGSIEIGEDFEIVELPVYCGSPLVGQTLASSGIREQTGVHVIGAWFRGTFETPPSADATITNGTVLLVTGHSEELNTLKERVLADVRPVDPGETVVVGHGQVGQMVTDQLDEHGVPYTVVDVVDSPDVDIVGDATDPEVLREAGCCRGAKTVIIAVPDDTTAEFATLVIREESPAIEIIVRANESRNVTKLYRAGADYVSSLATVSGRMTAGAIVEEDDILDFGKQVNVVRTSGAELAGRTLGEVRVRTRTGCTVVAIERDGEVLTDVGPAVRVEEGDDLIIAGTDEGVRRFNEILG